ncbi:MAG: hypothetical protein ACEPOV_05765 [Hyphomicrobiales bacterium]
MRKNNEIHNLISYADYCGCFRFSDIGFTTKSGMMFKFETDFRKACDTVHRANMFMEIVYKILITKLQHVDLFLGVPETGSIMSIFLNQIHQKKNPDKEIPLNMVRVEPKNYIRNAPVTVNPIIEPYDICIIEDDVVSGHTLYQYLDLLKCVPRKTINIVSIIDRNIVENNLSVKEKIESDYSYSYTSLIQPHDLEEYFDRKLT